MTTPTTHYRLTFRVGTHFNDPPVRLQGLLKVALRLFNFKATDIEALDHDPQAWPSIIELDEMIAEEATSDDPLSPLAVGLARNVLLYVERAALPPLPRVHMCPDGEGGIRFRWLNGDSDVRVNIGATREPYIYHAGMGESAVLPYKNAALGRWLRRMVVGETTATT